MYTLCKSIAGCPHSEAFPNTSVINQIQSRTEPESEKIYSRCRNRNAPRGPRHRGLGAPGVGVGVLKRSGVREARGHLQGCGARRTDALSAGASWARVRGCGCCGYKSRAHVASGEGNAGRRLPPPPPAPLLGSQPLRGSQCHRAFAERPRRVTPEAPLRCSRRQPHPCTPRGPHPGCRHVPHGRRVPDLLPLSLP